MDDAARLEVAIRAAREGGRVAREHVGDPLYYSLKGHREVVVGAALKVQDTILRHLRAAFPDEAILAEEGPEDEVLPLDAPRLWVVDPIDGSINYFQRVPHFAVSVGFREGSVYRLGVVYDPMRDELFSATVGHGAKLNGEPIFVHRPGEGEDVFDQTVIGTDWPTGGERRIASLRAAAQVASRMLALNVMGSPALGLCYVAAGRAHGYFHLDLRLWDVAAAAVILQEAGGVLTNGTGGSWLYSDGGYVATNGAIHGVLLRLIRVGVGAREEPERPRPAEAGA
jgi:myo-inositol-1(or 4)-monophosphatase